jgi:hypothetical protein
MLLPTVRTMPTVVAERPLMGTILDTRPLAEHVIDEASRSRDIAGLRPVVGLRTRHVGSQIWRDWQGVDSKVNETLGDERVCSVHVVCLSDTSVVRVGQLVEVTGFSCVRDPRAIDVVSFPVGLFLRRRARDLEPEPFVAPIVGQGHLLLDLHEEYESFPPDGIAAEFL